MATMRRNSPFEPGQEPAPVPQSAPPGNGNGDKEEATPMYVTDNPSVYGTPPPAEEDKK